MITLPCTLTIPSASGTEQDNAIKLSSVQVDLVGKTATLVLAYGNYAGGIFTKSSVLPIITTQINLSNGVVNLQGTQIATVVSAQDLNTLAASLHDLEFLVEDWLVEKGYLVGTIS